MGIRVEKITGVDGVTTTRYIQDGQTEGLINPALPQNSLNEYGAPDLSTKEAGVPTKGKSEVTATKAAANSAAVFNWDLSTIAKAKELDIHNEYSKKFSVHGTGKANSSNDTATAKTALDPTQKSDAANQDPKNETVVGKVTGAVQNFAANSLETVKNFVSNSWNWLWSAITGSSNTTKNEEVGVKVLTPAEIKRMQDIIINMGKCCVNDILTDDEQIKFEELMKKVIALQKEEAAIILNQFQHHFEQKKIHQKAGHLERAKGIELHKKEKFLSKFEGVGTGAQVLATSVVVGGSAAVAGALLAIGIAVDSLMDNTIKKKIAGLFVGQDDVKQQKAAFYMNLGLGFLAFGSAWKLGENMAMTAVAGLISGSSKSAEAVSKNQKNKHKAIMEDNGFKVEFHQQHVKEPAHAFHRLMQLLDKWQTQMSKIVKGKTKVIKGIFRSQPDSE